MDRQKLLSVFFIALLGLIFYQIVLIFLPFINSIFWAAILAFCFYPLFRWLSVLSGGRRKTSALLTTVVIFLIFAPLIWMILFNVTRECAHFYRIFSEAVQDGRAEAFFKSIVPESFIREIQRIGIFEWDVVNEKTDEWLSNFTDFVSRTAVKQLLLLTKNILLAAVNAAFALLLIFFFLVDGERIYRFTYKIVPLEEETKHEVFTQISDVLSVVLRGQLLTALVQSITAGAIFWILRTPLPFLCAALTFLTSLVPVLGASSVWMSVVIYLLFKGLYAKAFILFLFGLLVISLLDNFLKPYIIGQKTKLPFFLLFFGILGGLKVFGLMGIFIAPTLLSLFFVLIRIYQRKYLTG